MIATRLGPYEITAKLGEGGMGEVYRATDSDLRREVAIKVLPAAFTADPERLARFEREAQLLAQLHHPNIASIFGLEKSGGVRALVMELVEGPTLGEKLGQGKLTLEETIAIAKQIAEALEAAHEKGIVHRDLKPENVKLTPDGAVKVLDFGLAKALDPGTSSSAAAPAASPTLMHSPTLTAAGTQLGVILGTAAYMAPEQARGAAVDKRADIWAFGVVLHEMLAGKRLFDGESAMDTLSAVMRQEIDLAGLPPETPRPLRTLLGRCLERNPKHRLRDIGDARYELEAALGGGAGAASASDGEKPAPTPRSWRTRALVAGGLVAATLLGVVLGRARSAPTPAAATRSLRAAIELPPGHDLDGFGSPVLALSRDGSTLAFLAREATGPQRLWVRRLDEDAAKLVPGSETAEAPMFSPDGGWVAFAVGVSGLGGGVPRELRKYSLATGLTQTVCAIDDYFGGVWREDGTILFLNSTEALLWAVPAGGGEKRVFLDSFIGKGAGTRRSMSWPALLPGERALVGSFDIRASGELAVLDLESKEIVTLGVRGSMPRYLSTGHLVFGGGSAALEVVPFDLASRKVTGSPVAMVPSLAFSRWRTPAFAVADDGTLAFATGYLRESRREPMRIVRASRAGAFEVMPIEPDLYGRAFAVSPDGRRLALARDDGGAWIADLVRGGRSRAGGESFQTGVGAAWSRRGDRLAWIASNNSLDGLSGFRLFVQPGDGSGSPEPLEVADSDLFVAGWEPDGASILFARLLVSKGSTVERFRPGGSSELLFRESGAVNIIRLSPDGRFLAFEVDDGEGFQIVIRVVATGERLAVTSAGGRRPSWSGDGRELYYSRDGAIFAVTVNAEGGGAPRIGAETRLFDWPNVFMWTASPDGSFYGTEPVPGAARQPSIQLRTGWLAEVERVAGRARVR